MYKILFADDEPWVTRGLEAALDWHAEGFEPLPSALDAIEALERIECMHPDLVILDIRMPEMSGLECARRAQAQGESCFFIILTGYAEFEYARESVELGVVSYLLKPYDLDELQRSIRKAKALLDARPATIPEDENDRIARIVQEIDEHYDQNLSLHQFAEQIFMRADYLCVLFKKTVGTTFGAYLAARRMRAAAELLCRTRAPIAEIAERVGYADAAAFARSFKRAYGTTPAKFREERGRREG